MKWFKHDSFSTQKASIERLILEFGIEGYGLYYACLELIAGEISIENLTFELDHDAELIANKFKMDTIKVGKIMHRCIELGLFDITDNGKIRCFQLAKMLDESTTKNPYVKELKKKLSGSIPESFQSNSGTVPETFRLDKIRLDKTRLDEIRKDKRESKNGTEVPTRASNSDNIQKTVAKDKFIKPTIDEVKIYSRDNNLNIDCAAFYDYYEMNGWKAGKNPMKDWKAAARNWSRRQNDFKPKSDEDKYHDELFL